MAISIHHLEISQGLFRLAACAVERRSIETGSFASIHDVIQHATDRAETASIDREAIEQATAMVIDGSIRISLIVRAPWQPTFKLVRERISSAAGRKLSVKQTIAVLLHQYAR